MQDNRNWLTWQPPEGLYPLAQVQEQQPSLNSANSQVTEITSLEHLLTGIVTREKFCTSRNNGFWDTNVSV
jgi:hypothetical protein